MVERRAVEINRSQRAEDTGQAPADRPRTREQPGMVKVHFAFRRPDVKRAYISDSPKSGSFVLPGLLEFDQGLGKRLADPAEELG